MAVWRAAAGHVAGRRAGCGRGSWGGGGTGLRQKITGASYPLKKAIWLVNKTLTFGLPTVVVKLDDLQSRQLPERIKVSEPKKRGRPIKMTIQRYADNPPATLPKTDHQRIKELKELMIRSGGKDVAEKVIEIALNDEHPGQMAALKMCMDRTLPVSMFEKDKSQRSAVTINITGLGAPAPLVEYITDV